MGDESRFVGGESPFASEEFRRADEESPLAREIPIGRRADVPLTHASIARLAGPRHLRFAEILSSELRDGRRPGELRRDMQILL